MAGLTKAYLNLVACMVAGYSLGWVVNRLETERLTSYRDKSALFGRELKPGEPPSWP
ncbi:NADH dehydrogenase [ubiquinone] 1 beta subcomplex subunit 1 [Osmia lignaria lignaria]|uniref:NADH dehydrogenase [ubiquinone] 1 beta subcomplex subunit 1 n=1 Tax=Osmia lignaria lignaria TaxID=1437193 RepID=UPI00402BE1F0